MDTTHFENERRSNGFAEINTKALPAGATAAEHSHPFEVRALVLERQIASTVAGGKRTYAKGDVFTMAADCRHAEQVGSAGVSYLVGRRHSAVG
jgi:quercetin dioxygenase-like cupin family protein